MVNGMEWNDGIIIVVLLFFLGLRTDSAFPFGVVWYPGLECFSQSNHVVSSSIQIMFSRLDSLGGLCRRNQDTCPQAPSVKPSFRSLPSMVKVLNVFGGRDGES